MLDEYNIVEREENTLACIIIIRAIADHRDIIRSKQIPGSIEQIQRFKNTSKHLYSLNFGSYNI